MNFSKVIIGAVIACIAFFLLGYLFYGLLLGDTMANYFTCQRPMEELKFPFLILGNFFSGLFLAYLFSKWTDISRFNSGLIAGAMIGFLMSLAMDFTFYATSTVITSLTGILIDVAITVVMWGIVGGIVGWWLGRR